MRITITVTVEDDAVHVYPVTLGIGAIYVEDITGYYNSTSMVKLDNDVIRERVWDQIPYDMELGRWTIRKGMEELFGNAMDEATFAYIKENLYAFGMYINAVMIARNRVENNQRPTHTTSCLFHETELATQTSRDVFELVESSRNIQLKMKDPATGDEMKLEVVTPPALKSRVKLDRETWLVQQLEPYRKAIARWADVRMSALSQKLAQAETIYAKKGFESGLALSTQGWTFEKIGNTPYLVYPGKVYVQQIWDHDRQMMWKLPDELRNVMYIEDLHCQVGDRIRDLLAKGFHPHCMGNRRNLGGCCLGDLGNRPFAEVNKLIDQYKMCNMGSNYGGLPTMLCEILLNRRAMFDLNNYSPDDVELIKRFEAYRGYCSPEGVKQKGFMNKLRHAAGVRENDDENQQASGRVEVWNL